MAAGDRGAAEEGFACRAPLWHDRGVPAPPHVNDPGDDWSRGPARHGLSDHPEYRDSSEDGTSAPYPDDDHTGGVLDEPTELTPLLPSVAVTPVEAEAELPRVRPIGVAGTAAALTAVLVLGAVSATVPYPLVIFGVQALFVIVWTTATSPPAPWVVAGVGLGTAAAADLVSSIADPASLAPLAYVTAGAFALGMVGQLTRLAGRLRVTESLGATLAVAVGVVAFSTVVVLGRQPRGTPSIVACLLAAGVAVTVARLADLVISAPSIAPRVPRGGRGVLIGVAAGTVVAALVGAFAGDLSTGPAAVAGLITAFVAVLVDLSVGYLEAGRSLAGEAPAPRPVRYVQGPLAAFALAAPVAFATSTLLLVT
ncbi:MAG: hypothetical protein QOI74_3734 [Micromonosporaceae bacterium]|nr:hypothetical protein [Micromonosporaceae bacterium]